VLLRPRKGVLVMEQLHYADELRDATEVPIPAGDVKAQELTLAKQLIEQTANEAFEPQKYKDTVRERVLEAIQRKVDGQDITSDVTPEAGGGKIIDLMEALKASITATAPSEEKKKAGRKVS
jgi:DNA end-binding protein Ku